jgi:diguanylate cyclase (GGDEF)-like protein
VQPLERLQELLQDGPCADSLRTQTPVAIADMPREARWPEFRDLAAGIGLGAVLSVPLLSRGRSWGVLDLYRCDPSTWSSDDMAAAEVLADTAVSFLVMAYDRDDARSAHRTLAHRATHDELTGLPNRGLLFDRLEHALHGATRRDAGVAVVFVDLDRFKSINDGFGHEVGDRVLVEVARRFLSTLREADTLARFAGDEFLIVCEGLPHEAPSELAARVGHLTKRLQKSLGAPVSVGSVDVMVSASMGVAITTDGLGAQELVSDADTAMYTAKQAGRGQTRVRDHTLTSGPGYALRLERDLAGALAAGELRLHFQPILEADGQTLAAVEALLRWQRPDDVLLPAIGFVDIATRTGLISSIGRWVVEQTCAQMTAWSRDLRGGAPKVAFVNLSARELNDVRLPEVIEQALATHGLGPAQLGLEVVEDHLADGDAVERLCQLSDRGHPLSIDDFGTGYSSLSRLLELPANYVKIDKSFVAKLPDDARSRRLIDGILQLAGSLDLAVVAEGVETAEQAEHLVRAGCGLLQGYHLGRPSSAETLTAAWRSGG